MSDRSAKIIFTIFLVLAAIVGFAWIFSLTPFSLSTDLGALLTLIGVVASLFGLYRDASGKQKVTGRPGTPRKRKTSKGRNATPQNPHDEAFREYMEQIQIRSGSIIKRLQTPNWGKLIITTAIGLILMGAGAFIPYVSHKQGVVVHPSPTASVVVTSPCCGPATTTVTAIPGSVTPHATTTVKNPCTYSGHMNEVLSVAWSPSGRRIASSDKDGTMLEWDPATCKTVATFNVSGGTGYATDVAWSPDGKYLAVSRVDATVVVWQDATPQPSVNTYRGHLQQSVNGVAWSPDSQYIASVSTDQTLQVWNFTNSELLFPIVQLGVEGDAVAWSSDGKYIATGCLDGTVQIWDATNGHPVFKYNAFTGNAPKVNAVAWSHNNQFIAAASSNGQLKVWNFITRSQTPVATFSDQSKDLVLSVAWSPDDKRIAYGNAGDYIYVVSFPAGRVLYDGKLQGSWIYGVAWSPDGKWIASGSADHTVHLIEVPA